MSDVDPERELTITADLAEIPRVSSELEEAMRACDFSEEAILDIQLAVEEAIANIVLHGYQGAPGEVEIRIHVTRGALQVRISDSAPPFNPLLHADPDRGSDLSERHVGNLGIYLMRRVVNDIHYQYAGGKNVLTLVKKRAT